MDKKRKKQMGDPVIAVDKNFMPMMTVTRRHAVKALVTERAEALSLDNWTRSAWFEMDDFHTFKIIIYPHVLAVKESKLTIGRGFRGILERDKYVCQYCGPTGPKATTIDHVLPRSRGGTSSPNNLVACCFKCNQRKGDKTPDEANMPLIQPIRSFRWNLLEKFHQLCERPVMDVTYPTKV